MILVQDWNEFIPDIFGTQEQIVEQDYSEMVYDLWYDFAFNRFENLPDNMNNVFTIDDILIDNHLGEPEHWSSFLDMVYEIRDRGCCYMCESEIHICDFHNNGVIFNNMFLQLSDMIVNWEHNG